RGRAPAMTGQGLLDPDFVRELSLLRRRLKVDVRSGGHGEHVARRRGGSAEFQEHRPYAPGDDLRRIDWLAFARSGMPVVKTFRAEEDVDRKSTRLNSSHDQISYAVFCLKKKKNEIQKTNR